MFNCEVCLLDASHIILMLMDIGAYQAVGSFFDKYISYSQARAMQNDMNEYNSPVRQVARLRQAGLSPWNYAGDGNQSAQPVVSDSKLAESLGSIADRGIAKRQADAQIKLAESQAEQTKSLTRTNDTLLKYLDESERERIDNTKASTGNLNASTAEIAKRVSRYDEQVNQDLAQKKAGELLSYSQSAECKALTNRINRMLAFEIKESKSRVSVNDAQIATLKTQADLNNKQVENLTSMIAKNAVEINKIGVEIWALRHSNQIWQKTGVKPGTPAWTAIIDVLGAVINEYVP